MGHIARIIKKFAVKIPMLNNRFTVELCENVHLHYRNLRLEFNKKEFLYILQLLKTLDEEEIENFKYGLNNFKSLVYTGVLPDKTEWNDRLQIEEQMEGHYHVHYRNLRIELKTLDEVGF